MKIDLVDEKLEKCAEIEVIDNFITWLNTNVRETGVRKIGDIPDNFKPESFTPMPLFVHELIKFKNEVTHRLEFSHRIKKNYFHNKEVYLKL